MRECWQGRLWPPIHATLNMHRRVVLQSSKYCADAWSTCPVTREPAIPRIDLQRVDVPQFLQYDHNVGAFLVTADDTVAELVTTLRSRPPVPVATDIETRGLGQARFQITCVTVAFQINGDVYSLLFDPLRRPEHRKLLAAVYDHATELIFHNSTFDVAPLYAHRLITAGQIRKIKDTLVAARMVNTHSRGGRSLEELTSRYKLMSDDRIKLREVMASRGGKKDDGFFYADIDSPTYVVGAMADTVATLRLWGVPGIGGQGMPAEAARYISAYGAGYGGRGRLSAAEAEKLVDDIQRVNQIVLARTARGYAVDTDYLDKFHREYGPEWSSAHQRLQSMGVRPGQGIDIVTALHQRGELPMPWPLTKGGRLSADKKAMERLESIQGDNKSPMLAAHQEWMLHSKTHRYVSKALENAEVTGRMHPEFNILGGNATGRMSCGGPEVQQFTDAARGVIVPDGDDEWVSVDWKSIEPVVMATAAGDGDFLAAMRAGADPYEPIGDRVGLDRKSAKRLMLANLYGQGAESAAATHNLTREKVEETFATLREELPVIYRLIDAIKAQSRQRSYVMTLTGRVLNQDLFIPAEGRTVIKEHIAPNHFCQGSALDVLHHSILELDDLGLSDHIHLWMHDELVADKSIEEELKCVMSTPPPFLAAAAAAMGIEPFLAVDANDVGHFWKSV